MRQFYLSIFILILTCGYSYAADDIDSHFIYQDYSKRISMDFKGAALVDVLKIFSKQSGQNFIAASDILDKKVTLFFDNIPMQDALNKILDANDLTYEAKPGSDIFIVKTKTYPDDQIITRTFPLKFATVSTAALNSTITVSSAAVKSDTILSAVKAVLSKDGSVFEDTRTNSIIVKDKVERFDDIAETIASLDVAVPLILIEVEMLDISKATSELMGAKFGTNGNVFNISQATKTSFYPFNEGSLLKKEGSSSAISYTAGRIDPVGMNIVVDFLKTKTDTRNLAKPRIMTLNNKSAEIKISTNEAVGVTKSTDTASSSASSTETAERVQTGVFLTVTPQANLETKEILMAVYPRVIQARLSTFRVNGSLVKDPEERGTQSLLKVQDGETIIIGGLLREDMDSSVEKVPFLSNIPILGAAFRHKNKSNTQRELIIFITPHIITDSSVDHLLIHPKISDKAKSVTQSLNMMENGL